MMRPRQLHLLACACVLGTCGISCAGAFEVVKLSGTQKSDTSHTQVPHLLQRIPLRAVSAVSATGMRYQSGP